MAERAPAPTRADFRMVRTIPTRWMDNDHYGHVNNVTYYSYFDTAVNGWLIEATATDIRPLFNDYGTVKFFGVDTFTTGIYRTWFGIGERQGAAQLSAVLLVRALRGQRVGDQTRVVVDV
ncbi:MAG: hypothetical protein ACO218_05290, partial [Steroidobacteraceae bacterium]